MILYLFMLGLFCVFLYRKFLLVYFYYWWLFYVFAAAVLLSQYHLCAHEGYEQTKQMVHLKYFCNAPIQSGDLKRVWVWLQNNGCKMFLSYHKSSSKLCCSKLEL